MMRPFFRWRMMFPFPKHSLLSTKRFSHGSTGCSSTYTFITLTGWWRSVLSHTSTLATNTFTISWRSLGWCMRKSLSLWRNWRVGYAPTSYPFRTHPQAASSKGPQWPWQTSLSMAQQRREKATEGFFSQTRWPCQMQQVWSPQTLWSIVSSMLNGPQCYKWDTSYSEALNLLKTPQQSLKN